MQTNLFSPLFRKVLLRSITIFLSLGLASFFAGCTNKEQIRKSAFNYFQEGNKAYEARDFQSAVWNYIHAINLDDQSPDFHYNLGLAYFETGKLQDALDSFTLVQEMRPNMADPYYNMALIYNKLYKPDLANKYYNRYQLIIKTQANMSAANMPNPGLPQNSNPAMNPNAQNRNAQASRNPQQAGMQARGMQLPQGRSSRGMQPAQGRQGRNSRGMQPAQGRQGRNPRGMQPAQGRNKNPRGMRPNPNASQGKAPVMPGLPAWDNSGR